MLRAFGNKNYVRVGVGSEVFACNGSLELHCKPVANQRFYDLDDLQLSVDKPGGEWGTLYIFGWVCRKNSETLTLFHIILGCIMQPYSRIDTKIPNPTLLQPRGSPLENRARYFRVRLSRILEQKRGCPQSNTVSVAWSNSEYRYSPWIGC